MAAPVIQQINPTFREGTLVEGFRNGRFGEFPSLRPKSGPSDNLVVNQEKVKYSQPYMQQGGDAFISQLYSAVIQYVVAGVTSASDDPIFMALGQYSTLNDFIFTLSGPVGGVAMQTAEKAPAAQSTMMKKAFTFHTIPLQIDARMDLNFRRRSMAECVREFVATVEHDLNIQNNAFVKQAYDTIMRNSLYFPEAMLRMNKNRDPSISPKMRMAMVERDYLDSLGGILNKRENPFITIINMLMRIGVSVTDECLLILPPFTVTAPLDAGVREYATNPNDDVALAYNKQSFQYQTVPGYPNLHIVQSKMIEDPKFGLNERPQGTTPLEESHMFASYYTPADGLFIKADIANADLPGKCLPGNLYEQLSNVKEGNNLVPANAFFYPPMYLNNSVGNKYSELNHFHSYSKLMAQYRNMDGYKYFFTAGANGETVTTANFDPTVHELVWYRWGEILRMASGLLVQHYTDRKERIPGIALSRFNDINEIPNPGTQEYTVQFRAHRGVGLVNFQNVLRMPALGHINVLSGYHNWVYPDNNENTPIDADHLPDLIPAVVTKEMGFMDILDDGPFCMTAGLLLRNYFMPEDNERAENMRVRMYGPPNGMWTPVPAGTGAREIKETIPLRASVGTVATRKDGRYTILQAATGVKQCADTPSESKRLFGAPYTPEIMVGSGHSVYTG